MAAQNEDSVNPVRQSRRLDEPVLERGERPRSDRQHGDGKKRRRGSPGQGEPQPPSTERGRYQAGAQQQQEGVSGLDQRTDKSGEDEKGRGSYLRRPPAGMRFSRP